MEVYGIDRPRAMPEMRAVAHSEGKSSPFEAVPSELRERPQWVVWRKLTRKGKATKVPFRSELPQAEASTTDPATWSSFEAALAAFHDPDNRLDGIGFVFTIDDDLAGIDFDNCLDEQGNVLEWARPHLDRVVGYAEVSPSGRGIKAIVRGEVPGGKGRKLLQLGPDGTGAIEVYDRGRYFTVTGLVTDDDHAEIGDDPAPLAELHAEWFPPKPTRQRIEPTGPAITSDDDLIRKAERARNGGKFSALMGGSIEGHHSKSEADLALCSHLAFWTGGDVDAMDRIFRRSLLCDEKWTNRADYRERTIARALEGSKFYDPGQRNGVATVHKATAAATASPGPAGSPPSLRIVGVEPDPERINPTDTGNALRFARDHRGRVRYCGQYGKWLAWDGRRWREDGTGEIYRLAARTVQKIGGEAAATDNPDLRKALLAWAMESESRKRIDAMIHLARFVEGIPVEPADLDKDRWLLNVRNGTIDLQTARLRPHRQEDLITKLADVDYDPDASCPRWERFELEIMDGDEAMVHYLRRIAGYAITGDVREHQLYFFFGAGRNGKSLWLDIILKLLGDYATTVDASLITAKQQEDHPTGLTELEGRRFVSTIEVADGKKMAEALVKKLTGGDPIKARRMRQDFYQFDPTHKLILAANHKPEIRGKDEGIWERIKLIPFPVTFVEAARVDPSRKLLLKDKALDKALKKESPGILALLVRSCLEWQRDGLQEPSAVAEATAGYRAEMDDLAEFLDQRCTILEGIRSKATFLYDAYVTWAKASGLTPMISRDFGSEMERRGFALKKSNSIAWRLGIAIRDERSEEDGYA